MTAFLLLAAVKTAILPMAELRTDFVETGIDQPLPAELATGFRCDFDASNLYLHVETDLSCNTLELMIDERREFLSFHHVFLLTNGTHWTKYNFRKDVGRKDLVYRYRREAGRQLFDLTVPALKGEIRRGDAWGFDLVRYSGRGITPGMWQFINGAYDAPLTFGRLVFGEEPPPVDARAKDAAEFAAFRPMTIVKDFSCDDWTWEQLSFGDMETVRKIHAKGGREIAERRGPVMKKCVGWFPSVGFEAKGVRNSAWELPPRAENVVVGCHGEWGRAFSAGRRYLIEAYVKGRGEFVPVMWHYVYNLASGAEKLHRFEHLKTVKLTDDWQFVSFEYETPPPPEGFGTVTGCPFGISVAPTTHLFVDELKVWELHR